MPEQQRPNFILLFPDQWRGDCLGALGHPSVETPYLDQIASEGTLFTSAYTASPSCIAARASMATGQTPSTCGRMGYRDCVPWRYPNTMMRCLRDDGYQTLNVGKTHFFPQRAALGFEEMRLYEATPRDPGFKSDYHAWLEKETNGTVRDTVHEMSSNSWMAKPWIHEERLHPNYWTTDAAIELLTRRDPLRPFFLQVGYHRPHPPIDPPMHVYEMYRDKELPPVPIGDWTSAFDHPVLDVGEAYEGHLPDHVLERSRKAYYAQMTHLDTQIGRLCFWLRKRGLLENTWIIFTSDHGELLGDHHLFRKFNAFEGSARIPFVVRAPRSAKCPQGQTCVLPVTLMDIMPTFLQEADVPIPDNVEGSSLSPLLRGEEVPWREYIHGEHTRPNRGWQYVTDGKEKFIWDSLSGEEWFFDLAADRQECTNLIADASRADRIEIWRQRLVEVLGARPQDGLSDGKQLIKGKIAPTVRPELLEDSEA